MKCHLRSQDKVEEAAWSFGRPNSEKVAGMSWVTLSSVRGRVPKGRLRITIRSSLVGGAAMVSGSRKRLWQQEMQTTRRRSRCGGVLWGLLSAEGNLARGTSHIRAVPEPDWEGAISQSWVKEPGSARGAGRAGLTAATVEGGKGLQSVPSLIDQTSCELAGLQSWLALGRRGLFALAIILGSFEMKCLCKWSSVTLDRSRPSLWGSFFISVMMRDLHKQPP